MYVMDVRLPVQPAVPVVASLAAGTTATNTSRPEDPRIRERGERRPAGRGGAFTPADRDLVYAVTGEDVALAQVADLSPFAGQILTDRRAGRLPAGREITAAYLLRTGATLEQMGAPNPFSGAHLRRALLFLESRTSGRIDIVL